jgi:hypothetical protein
MLAKEKSYLTGPMVDLRYQVRPAGEKPMLLVEDCNPDRTLAALRDILAAGGGLYDRGVPVRLAFDQIQRGTVAQAMTPDGLVLATHGVCRPYFLKTNKDGTLSETNARLPRSFAVMYLDWRGEWRLPVLNGIATAPLLQDDGAINSAEGYDSASGLWCENVPDVAGLVPDRPTKDDAAAALRLIRGVRRRGLSSRSHRSQRENLSKKLSLPPTSNPPRS